MRCPQCEAELPRQARFCAYCGIAIETAAARPAPREERRVITALFADLAGSTQLGERLDPEDFRDLTGGALAQMGAAIEELGGTVRGTAGDGVLGLFGAPTAHEDDAERAVIAGLRLVEKMRQYAVEAAIRWQLPELRVRVGIETGLAVLGEVRAGTQVQYDASGDCLNTAARLEGAAEANGVLVGPVTYRLVSQAFDWGEPCPLALKGKAEPVLARHALAPREERPHGGSSAPAVSRLVGRDRELGLAAEIVSEVTAGRSRTVFVTGQAGIGKTRIVRELRSLFVVGGHDTSRPTWLEGTCVSYGADQPYLPFRQVIRQALGGSAGSTADVRELLAPLVGRKRAARAAPMVSMLLGLATEPEDSSHIAGLTAELLLQAVTEACTELVTGLVERGPVAIALDDVHWADAASLRLVEGLVSALDGELPVLLVLSMRSETDGSAWATRGRVLDRQPLRSRELRLASLDRDAERRLVSDLVGEDTLPEDLESLLLGRAEGNPFFLGELLRSLRDTGAIVRSAGRWRFDRTVPIELPDTVERVVLARIDRLPPRDRDLLDAAAVIGREFDLQLLGRIAEVDLSPESLSNLTGLGLIEAASDAADAAYRFSHPLIQETTYLSMLRRGRAKLHGRAAAAIEQLTEEGSDQLHAILARHHSAAGQVAEAVKYHRLAGLAALRMVALDEAVKQLGSAISAAVSLDPDAGGAQLPELYLLRGRARGRAGDYVGGPDDIRQALARARAVSDGQVEVRALTDLGWLMRVYGYEQALELHQQALQRAEELDDPSTQVTALAQMSLIRLNRLQLDRGLELAQRATEIARATGQDHLLGAALDALKFASLQLGDLQLLEQTTTEIIEVQQRAGDLFLLQWAYIEGATAPLARGDLGRARERISHAVDLNSRSVSNRVTQAMMLEALSWIDRAAGDLDAAVVAVHDAMDTLGALTTPEWSAWLEASLGSHLIARGDPSGAIPVLESALAHSEAIESPNRTFRAATHLAWARRLVGDTPGSRSALVRAEHVLSTITAPPGAVFLDGYRSYLALAQTYLAGGDPSAARGVLTPLLAAARRQGWTTAAHEAAETLTMLSATPRPPRADPF